ncbi:Hypothetical predicted protein [Lecanosticta acicola]|uniref:Uncharacterized protein n=1 Tax=Lecanosticta acicola TaxID=111012 RepID=A0AAI8YUQ9_9PEZI|nr:Hypothetical predicted protein [Lecanosticta acicola]
MPEVVASPDLPENCDDEVESVGFGESVDLEAVRGGEAAPVDVSIGVEHRKLEPEVALTVLLSDGELSTLETSEGPELKIELHGLEEPSELVKVDVRMPFENGAVDVRAPELVRGTGAAEGNDERLYEGIVSLEVVRKGVRLLRTPRINS